MGIKDLWPLLEPYAERKSISELRGKIVAIDLAGWICESLNVVDYFVYSKNHLKNLFFRTCYLIWEEVTPVFVLDGVAPELKQQVIVKRNELQFRGVKPKDKPLQASNEAPIQTAAKGRTRFNHVLKQCELLLSCMGIQCVQAPGEAEAFAAFLNKKGYVDGVISQDSDCFAYGAQCVYRNFSISIQGGKVSAGGAIDVYDLRHICSKMDFGQHKVIVMALLCGCDYCPDGVGGIGRESVYKLLNKYKNDEILERVRSWRKLNNKYTEEEVRVDDKNICSNCGHIGRTARHTTHGCGICRTTHACDASLWREQRLSIKAELLLRKKALVNDNFPNEQIISEFLNEPKSVPHLNLNWNRPNIIMFMTKLSQKLQWEEIYCFQKFLPLVTRWQLRNIQLLRESPALMCLQPKQFVKKRTVKSILCMEIIWQDVRNCLQGLIPAEQLEEYNMEHKNCDTQLWTTIEPWQLVEMAYPTELQEFVKSKEKPKKIKATTKGRKKKTVQTVDGLLDRFISKQTVLQEPPSTPKLQKQCSHFVALTSTPGTLPMNLSIEMIDLSDSEQIFDMSDLVNAIVEKHTDYNMQQQQLQQHAGKQLYYQPFVQNLNPRELQDDLDLLAAKKRVHSPNTKTTEVVQKRGRLNVSLDDSFDVLVKQKNHRLEELMQRAEHLTENLNLSSTPRKTHITRFMQEQHLLCTPNISIKETEELCDSLSILDISN